MKIDRLLQEVEASVPNILRATLTPGVTIALADAHGTVVTAGHGVADLSTSTTMAADAVMKAGSMSKLYIAVAVMRLVEQGILDLHAPMNRYITDFPVRNPFGLTPVTAYDLLTHQSGLGPDSHDALLTDPPQIRDYLAAGYLGSPRPEYHVSGARWTKRVGAEYQYSSFGMATLAYLVEVINPFGVRFDSYLSHDVWEPLEMTSTALPRTHTESQVPPSIFDRLTTGYSRFGGWCVPTPLLHSGTYPATNLLTTASDHVRFLSTMLPSPPPDVRRVISPAILASMITPESTGQGVDEAPGLSTGLGVEMRNLGRKDYYFGHGGAYPFGWWGDSRVYPHLGFAIVVFANAWDMVRYHNPHDRSAAGLIAASAASIASEQGTENAATPSWDWAASYAMGVLLGERVHALLGIDGQLADAEVSELVRDARPVGGSPTVTIWDETAFHTGLSDVTAFAGSPNRLRRFLGSSACKVSRDQLALHMLAFGASRAHLPIPLAFWSDRQAEDRETFHHLDHYLSENRQPSAASRTAQTPH